MSAPVNPLFSGSPAGPALPRCLAEPVAGRCCAGQATADATPACGSRKRRLWELGSHTHCPVVGVCLPMAALRRLARKALGGEPVADDYELHRGIVAECRQRTGLAQALQRELDHRYLLPVKRASAIKSESALIGWWEEQGASTDLPGALWATLTHPRCTPAIEHHVVGRVHMIQHQVGMATRVDLQRFEALIDENVVVARELANAQQRSTRQAAEFAARIAASQSEILRLRGEVDAAQRTEASLREDLQALRASVAELDSRQALAERNRQLAARVVALQQTLHRERCDHEKRRNDKARGDAADRAADCPIDRPAGSGPAEIPIDTTLLNRSVLCVGGRTASVPAYRQVVEGRGARFLHHDGGLEHSPALLESTLAAADLVICQAGCISHSAYWRVKDHCRRTGKRCLFVESPGASSLQRALAEDADRR